MAREYDVSFYPYEEGGLNSMVSATEAMETRKESGWWMRETYRGAKGVEVLWEREAPKVPKLIMPGPGEPMRP